MASTKVKAIVLGGVNIKEKDKLITLFTLEKGKISVSMKGVRSEKAKLKSAKDIFTFGEFCIEEGKTNIITAVDIIDNFYELSKDIDCYYEACAIIDIANKISSNEPNPFLFIEIIKALKTICYDKVRKYYVFDKFMLSILHNMGYGFLSDKCSSCGTVLEHKFFNYDVGEIVCARCQNSLCEKISEATFSAMKLLAKTEYEKLVSVRLGGMGEVQTYHLLTKNFLFRTGHNSISF